MDKILWARSKFPTPFRALFHVAILHQGGSFFGGSNAQIQAHQRFGSDGFAPGHEFIGAKLVGVDGIPRLVECAPTVLLRAVTVKPVIAGDKISSRIADDGNTKLAYLVHHIFAQTIGVR